MSDILEILPNETEDEYLFRIGESKRDGLIDLTWEEIADLMNSKFRTDETEYRTESSYRKKFKNYIDAKLMMIKQDVDTNQESELKLRDIEKARVKLRTEKLEYNRWIREGARDELICEHICEAIKSLPPLEIPKLINLNQNSEKIGILTFADCHYGAEFVIHGLFGEILNEYSPEIFEQKMWKLLQKTIEIVEKEGFTTINVYDLGDSIDGLLRVSQLMKLRYGVIESTVRYGRFITEWLNELTKYVKVKYQMVKDSNHSQLRLWGQPKNTFKDENMSIIIAEKILDRLTDNPNFEFIQNPTGYVFDQLVGYNFLCIHGEEKNMSQAIKDFSSVFKVKIDYLIGAHKHHKISENVAVESDVINIPSIIGADDYSMSLHKTSDSGALFLVVKQGEGVAIEYNIKL